ncbi:MAG: biotin synthase BioB [Methanosphaera sp. rholeuAM6]|nr:MAG: biotin synthase BioB [Methanosphaera sp. rholeuAM6]
MTITELTSKVLNGYKVDKSDAIQLLEVPLNELTFQANKIRYHFCGNNFDACTIINVKSGKCSEDCKFCSQSIHYKTDIREYPLLSKNQLEKQTLGIYNTGFKRISYVASGKTITEEEFKQIEETVKNLKEKYADIKLCVSLGLLTQKQVEQLEQIGVDRIHNNLETSKTYFPKICTTHSYHDKLATLEKINNKTVKICSGGIFGLGESFEDRIDLALELREHDIKSIPINILNPIKKTPLENSQILSNEEVCRIIAIFRFINPDAYIRMAGGRLLLPDNGRKAFHSGSNAAILGNMLTTDGVRYEEDIKMIRDLGYKMTYEL